MIMDLNYPGIVNEFYSSIFDYVTFEVLPSDKLYAMILFYKDEPFSEQADTIGYGSRYIITNSGSISIFIFLLSIRSVSFALLRLCIKSGRIGNYLRKTNDRFLWSGALDFLNAAYICLSFSFCINSTNLKIDSTSTAVNNIYAVIIGACLIFAPIYIVKKFLASQKPLKTYKDLYEGGEIDEKLRASEASKVDPTVELEKFMIE